jgi:hypothetical protein
MNEVALSLLEKYDCRSILDYENALKEIIQEIVLLGLWRGKFFEHSAFYGGTALRILYNLDRFSEDIDFTLLKKDDGFSLKSYLVSIKDELESYGFQVVVEDKIKSLSSPIESAFVKANTLYHLLQIDPGLKTHPDSKLKVKIEIDTDPAPGFMTESVAVFTPIPYSVKTLQLPDLFSGKLHALIARTRIQNIKGRDWYDFLWFISKNSSFRITYLENKLIQSGHIGPSDKLDTDSVKSLLRDVISNLDIEHAKNDISTFITNRSDLDAWERSLFYAACDRLHGI